MKKTLKGVVTSDKMQKTVVVEVATAKRHKIYGKLIANSKKFLAHDEIGVIKGDTVVIEEHKPFSKNVHFQVVEKVGN